MLIVSKLGIRLDSGDLIRNTILGYSYNTVYTENVHYTLKMFSFYVQVVTTFPSES